MKEDVAWSLKRLIRGYPPDRMNRNGKCNQGYCLYYVVRSVTKRAAFVVHLPGGMRVHNLHDAGKQDKRNAEHAKPCGPARLKTFFVLENMHPVSTIE